MSTDESLNAAQLRELAVVRSMSREELERACQWLAAQLSAALMRERRYRRKARR